MESPSQLDHMESPPQFDRMKSRNAFHPLAPASSSRLSFQCDIFISYRVKDSGKKLASTIYQALTILGYRVYRDVEELKSGDVFPEELQAAMDSASVHIAIISVNNPKSVWCLAELYYMLEIGKTVIPIFYYVDLDDVKGVKEGKGSFADAFSVHETDINKTYSGGKLEEWKTALSNWREAVFKATLRQSFKFDDTSGDEGWVLKDVVDRVKEAINRAPFEVAKFPVGMDEAVEKFERYALQSAQKHRNVKIHGIVGMGGRGKTTLAKELFNRKCSSFEKSSFIFDIRAAAEQNKLHKKLKKLLQDLGISDSSLDNVEDGKRFWLDSSRYVRALIVLDDVGHKDQLDALLPNLSNLGPDSLVIVTTKDLGVLRSWDIFSIYEMPGLNDLQATQLFCCHAFGQHVPLSGFEILVEDFLKACNGLPLSLKVLGGQLHGRKCKDYWQSQLNKISRILPADIKQRLKVSFDALDEEEQEMFLDVACFFIGKEKSVAIAVWDGSGWSGLCGLETLVDKCLVEVHTEEQWNSIFEEDMLTEIIRMHDNLRDMGREIATTHSPHRYWSPQHTQKNSKGIMPIRGINSKNLNLENFLKTFRGTPASDILLVSGSEFTEEIVSLSEDLVWLGWYRFPHRNLPSWISFTSLAVLQIYGGDIEELWGDSVDPPLKLIELDITGGCNLKRIPTSIGRLEHLKRIIFYCSQEGKASCSSLPEEFCGLQSLEHLVLNCFVNLSSLPDRFGQLSNLRHLNLCGSHSLKELPVSFKDLINLEFLDLSRCKKLKLRSDILEKITKLKNLNIKGCKEVEELPTQITKQVSLERLTAFETSLRYLPNDIGLLRNLNNLSISSEQLTSLPDSLGNLSCLTDLSIASPRLTSLPFGTRPFALHKLKKISFWRTGLSELSISEDCCPNLKLLRIYDNVHLMEIRTLPTSIKEIILCRCKMLKNIKCLGGIENLRRLYIMICFKLHELPTFQLLSLLKEFVMHDCPKISRIEGIQYCTSLQKLEVETFLNISAMKPCLQSQECPRQTLCAFVQQILNSLEFPDLVVKYLEEPSSHDFNQYFSNSYFVLSISCLEVEEEEEEEEEGKATEYVKVTLYREASESTVKDFIFYISEAIVVAGEQANVSEALKKILALLE